MNQAEQTLLLISSAVILTTSLVVFIVQFVRNRGRDRDDDQGPWRGEDR
jgi:hypothetical protein